MSVGERISQKRRERGLTQSELGEKCGASKQTIYKYEKGVVTNIPLDVTERIAEALGVSPGYLMGWTDDPERHLPADMEARAEERLGLEEKPASQEGNGLAEGEAAILDHYRALNEEGRERLTNYAEDLVASGRYQKSTTQSVG